MKDLPEEDRQAIMANSKVITCSITGKPQYWKPHYELRFENEDTMQETRKRELETEENIKAMPKSKAAKVVKEAKKKEVGEDKELELEVPPKMIERLSKMVPKLEELILKATTVVAESKEDDVKDNHHSFKQYHYLQV